MDQNQAISHVLNQLGVNVAIGVLLLFALQLLLFTWLKARLESAIKHEYDRKLEDLRFEMKTREQAAKVAELFSEARDGDTSISRDRAKKLNRYAWELSLWLPSDLVREITKQLNFDKKRKEVKEILVEVRKHILNKQNDDLKPAEIAHFNPNSESEAAPSNHKGGTMAYAMVSVGILDPREQGSTKWQLCQQKKDLPKDSEMPTTSLLILALPDSLSFLADLASDLERNKVPYAISFSQDKPIFKFTPAA